MNTQTLKAINFTCIISFVHHCERYKYLGKNAVKPEHGTQRNENVVVIFTNSEWYGVGFGNIDQAQAAQLIGKSLADVFDLKNGVLSPLGRADHAIYDLVAKALGVPLWRLFGNNEQAGVKVYDSSFYFQDLIEGNTVNGIDRLMQELTDSLNKGHTAFKFKIGRGYKWMDKSTGFSRDVEVIRQASQLLGPEHQLLVDANNSYDLYSCQVLLQACGEHIYLMEEMFPEQLEHDLALKNFIRSGGYPCLLADGESEHDPEVFEQFIRNGALDVVQPDIRAFGLRLQWQMSQRLNNNPFDIKLATHCYGSHLGFYEMLMLGKGCKNFLIAEWDEIHSDLFDDSAWSFAAGYMHVPEKAGAGLNIRTDVFNQKYRSMVPWIVGANEVPEL